MWRSLSAILILFFALSFTIPTVEAAEIERSVPFALEKWIELGLEDGPVTVHRMRITKEKGGLTKSKLFRPGNDEYLETVQIQIEYSNDSKRDWEMRLDIEWVDSKGRAIDGYNDEEEIDSDERYDIQTVTLSTLRYGLNQARKLNFEITTYPD